jgi:G3E family GTPase
MTLTVTTLVTGAHVAAREAAIAQALDRSVATAVILEGIASGLALLEDESTSGNLQIIRIAPGCMCCVGNLTLRVNLNRILRKPPQRLFIALATDTHVEQVREFLLREPYDAFLTLTENLHAIAS